MGRNRTSVITLSRILPVTQPGSWISRGYGARRVMIRPSCNNWDPMRYLYLITR